MTPWLSRLHRSSVDVDLYDLPIELLYKWCIKRNATNIPLRKPESHTMYAALDSYVEQKLPTKEILAVAKDCGGVEISAIYPAHFERAYKKMWPGTRLDEIEFYHKPTTRVFNVVRPRFFIDRTRNRCVVAVNPGSDYLDHYFAFVRHLIWRRNLQCSLEGNYFPIAAETLSLWTRLDRGFVRPNDIVIIGYVQECQDIIMNSLPGHIFL